MAPRGPLCISQDAGALRAALQLRAELFALEGARGIRNAQLKCSAVTKEGDDHRQIFVVWPRREWEHVSQKHKF